jgi:DedD protein
MSFFNLRRGGQSSKSSKSKAGSNAPAESVDIVRKRAKHRLIGAAVLVLIGVVGFPLLFDSQPRPVPVDIAIEIPNKNTVRPLITQQPVPTSVPAVLPPVAAVVPSTPPKEEPVVAKPVPAATKVDDSDRARALLEGKAAPSVAESDTRLVVQVGAYADAAKAREARLKLEKAGLKTYTQVVDTKDGKRIRVRVGPFASKAEADKVAVKIKSLDLPVTILTL